MKNLIILFIIFTFSFHATNASPIKNCSSIKKISKEYIACKASNLKKGIVNTGSKIKKGTLSKAVNFKNSINNPLKKKDKKK